MQLILNYKLLYYLLPYIYRKLAKDLSAVREQLQKEMHEKQALVEKLK